MNANASSNQDLFWALKGGSNNFGKLFALDSLHSPLIRHIGIVTAFSMTTYPIHEVWGGIMSYSLDSLPELFSAMLEYQSNPNKDPYANLMMQAFTTNSSVGAVLNMVYLKPEVAPPAFAPFYPIDRTGDTTKIQTLTEMIGGQRVPLISRSVLRSPPLPHIHN